MGLKSFLRRKALEAELEGLGVSPEKAGPIADAINKQLMEGLLMAGHPGWKSSEFWLSLFTAAGNVIGSLAGVIPPKIAGIASVIIGGAYSIARGLAKHGTGDAPSQ